MKLSRDFCGAVLLFALALGRGFVWGGEGAASLSDEASKGKELAAAVCESCHLLPEPELLERETWEREAMAAWLGVATVNRGTDTEGKRIREAGIFPPSPLVTAEQWRALQAYCGRQKETGNFRRRCWLVMDAGDIDGDGDVDVALGSFPKGPQNVPIPDEIGIHWFSTRTSVLSLENVSRKAAP